MAGTGVNHDTVILISPSREAAVNLAVEESLLNTLHEGEELLLLYENDAAIVTGRFQNPWMECRIGLAKKEGIPLIRRISGGGTVVHGPGNLNLAILSGRPLPRKQANLDRIIQSLAPLGLNLRRNERQDLVADLPGGPKKVSGSAYRQCGGRSLHHATLLVDADLKFMKNLLAVPRRRIETRAVRSRPSPVTNLSVLLPGLTTTEVVKTLTEAWGGRKENLNLEAMEERKDFRDAGKRLNSAAWTLGRCPPFTETFSGLPGLDEFTIKVAEGRIRSAEPGGEFLIGRLYMGGDILAGSENISWLSELAARVDGEFSANVPVWKV